MLRRWNNQQKLLQMNKMGSMMKAPDADNNYLPRQMNWILRNDIIRKAMFLKWIDHIV